MKAKLQRLSTITSVVFALAQLTITPADALGALISITMDESRATAGLDVDEFQSTPIPGADFRIRSGNLVFGLPSPAPDSMERALNYQLGDPPSLMYTIREENAASFGLDWLALQNGLSGRNKQVSLVFTNGPPVVFLTRGITAAINIHNEIIENGFQDRDQGFLNFDMNEVRVKVDYYFWHPVLVGLRAAKITFEIDGSGELVPEPSTIGLVLLAPLAFLGRRRRTS